MSAQRECSWIFALLYLFTFVLPYCRSIAEAIAAASFLHAPLGISKLHPIDANRLGQGRVCTTAINGVRTTVAAAVVSLPCASYLPVQGCAPKPQGLSMTRIVISAPIKKNEYVWLWTGCGTPLVYTEKLQLQSEVLGEIDEIVRHAPAR